MNQFLLWPFTPKWNRYIILGLILTVVGIILIPFIIGIPIAGIGFGLFAIGAMISFANNIPGGKRVVKEFEKMFQQMFLFIRNLTHSVSP